MKTNFLKQFNHIENKTSLIRIIRKIINKITYRYLNEPTIFLNRNPKYNTYDIGDYTYGSPDGSPLIVYTGTKGKLQIGKFCSIAYNVIIFVGGSNHRPEWMSTYPFGAFFNEASKFNGYQDDKIHVTIGNDVWIGEGATIMSGINIGDGAVIASKSVVTKHVYPYSIVAGNPARVVRVRFDDNIIEELLEICWWNWNIKEILENIELILNDNPDKLIDYNKSKTRKL